MGAVQGTLENSYFPDLVHSLGRGRETGVLNLSHAGIEKNVYFGGGSMVFAQSSLSSDRLGEMLVERGRADALSPRAGVEPHAGAEAEARYDAGLARPHVRARDEGAGRRSDQGHHPLPVHVAGRLVPVRAGPQPARRTISSSTCRPCRSSWKARGSWIPRRSARRSAGPTGSWATRRTRSCSRTT